MNKKYVIDVAERLGWQVAYAAISTGVIELSHLSYAWAPALMLGLDAVKVVVAKHVGSPENAAIPGGSKTPAVEPAVTLTTINGGAA